MSSNKDYVVLVYGNDVNGQRIDFAVENVLIENACRMMRDKYPLCSVFSAVVVEGTLKQIFEEE